LFNTRYPELLKRLDDNSDPIRLASLKAWLAYAECMTVKPYDEGLYQAHADAVLRGLFIHLDDSEEVVQDAVGRVLKTMAIAVPKIVRRHAVEAKGRHRNSLRCQEIEALCISK
jgi:dynein assembly factor 5